MTISEDLVAVSKLSKDIRDAGATASREEARNLVDLYYRLQKLRIELDNQTRALTAAARPAMIVDFYGDQFGSLEDSMVKILDKFSMSKEVGVWSRSVKGIGPVIAAGFMAHIDIEKAPTVGHIWRFAGLDPTVAWNKGERRPWNADLRVLCWKAGQSFVKMKHYDDAFYAHLYSERKMYELHRDGRSVDGTIMEPAARINQECAKQTLLEKNFRDVETKKIYESGHLPLGRLDNRAKRWTVKLFLAHWHHVAYVEQYGENPPKPYILTQEGGHAHYIAPPGYSADVL